MPSSCSVPGCTSKQKGSKLSFFRLPKNLQMKAKWMMKLFGNVDFKHSDAIVCSTHFKEDDFERDLKSELLNLPRRRILKHDAVPSQNLQLQMGSQAINIVTNKGKTKTAPLGIIIYQYNIQDSNIQNSTITSSNVLDSNKAINQLKIRERMGDKLRYKLATLKGDLKAEKQKCVLLQRKMTELRNKVIELQSSVTKAIDENSEEKIRKKVDGLSSSNRLDKDKLSSSNKIKNF